MTLVVTGAAGFIGRHVVAALSGRGTAVTGIDRRAWTPRPGETALVADLAAADNRRVAAVLRRAAGVVHLAGCPGVRDERPDIARRRWRDNVLAGVRVLETVPEDVPVVVASSSSVYGGAGAGADPRPCRETDRPAPRGGYARSKHVLEEYAARRAARGGIVGVARPFTVAGEGQRPDMALSRWIAALLEGRPIRRYGGGDRRRDITDVRDVAEGLLRMLDRRVTATVNLGTGVTHRLDDVIALVAARCGAQPVVEVEPAAADDVPATCADVTACQRLLGFVPTTDLTALVDRQVAATVACGPPTLPASRCHA